MAKSKAQADKLTINCYYLNLTKENIRLNKSVDCFGFLKG